MLNGETIKPPHLAAAMQLGTTAITGLHLSCNPSLPGCFAGGAGKLTLARYLGLAEMFSGSAPRHPDAPPSLGNPPSPSTIILSA